MKETNSNFIGMRKEKITAAGQLSAHAAVKAKKLPVDKQYMGDLLMETL